MKKMILSIALAAVALLMVVPSSRAQFGEGQEKPLWEGGPTASDVVKFHEIGRLMTQGATPAPPSTLPVVPTSPAPPPGMEATPAVPGVSAIGSPTYVKIDKSTGGGFVNIGRLLTDTFGDDIDAIVQALIYAAAGFIAWEYKKKTGHDIDANLMAGFTRAAQNEAASLLADGKVKMDGVTMKVDNRDAMEAAQKIIALLPDWKKRFAPDPQFVADRVIDTLPQIAAGAQMIAQAHAQESSVAVASDPAVAAAAAAAAAPAAVAAAAAANPGGQHPV